MSKSKRVKRKNLSESDIKRLLELNDVPVLDRKRFDEATAASMEDFEDYMEKHAVVDHKRMRQLERDVATLQIELAALGERVDMVEAENKALRALWGGTTHNGVPYWAQTCTGTWTLGPKPTTDLGYWIEGE